jgi:hypothetical protein
MLEDKYELMIAVIDAIKSSSSLNSLEVKRFIIKNNKSGKVD